MAEKIGVNQGDLSKMEKGARPIGKKLAMRIGKALGIDYRRFL
jgi:plasmid maintenance system antidote protein VapI